MPIISMQRRLHQDGRIRIGRQVPTSNGKSRPTALDTFRFTSQNHRAIQAIADTYGGRPTPWESAPVGEQWEVLTEASDIPVVVPPEAMAYSQWYELWSGGGCQRRCDGEQETISDGPCLCDPESRACKPHTRLSVMLAQYPGTGLWRLDTSGYYAATELGGAMEIVGMLSQSVGKSVLPGRLRIEHRTVKRPDQPPNNFIVPVLEFQVDMAALATGNVASIGTAASEDLPVLPGPGSLTPVPMDDTPAPSLEDQLKATDTATRKRRANSGPELPSTGLKPRPTAESPIEELDPSAATTKQMNMLRAVLAKQRQITDNQEVHDVVGAYIGREVASLKDLSRAEASKAIDMAQAVE